MKSIRIIILLMSVQFTFIFATKTIDIYNNSSQPVPAQSITIFTSAGCNNVTLPYDLHPGKSYREYATHFFLKRDLLW